MRNPSKLTPKLVAVDLDGTLLGPTGTPHPRDVAALKAAAFAGVTVSILTGRLYSGTRPTAEILGLKGPVGCVDGSHVVDTTSHGTVLHHGIRGDHALHLRDSLAQSGSATFLFAKDSIVHDAHGESYLPFVSMWSRDIRPTGSVAEHDLWHDAEGVTAVVAVGTDSQINRAAGEIRRRVGDAAQVFVFPLKRTTEQWSLVARAAGGTKGTALRWLAHHHGLEMGETVVVGDWHNDVPMFREAGHAFAMAQAPDEVKAHATTVLKESGTEGGGIATVIERCFGLKV